MAEQQRLNRRMAGVLKARLPDLELGLVRDPRQARGKRWSLGVLLRTCVVGMMCRCKNLAQVELLSSEMSFAMRRMLGIARRVPDTTIRDTVVRVSPVQLRRCLHRQNKKAKKRKALEPMGLPFGVVAIDGKGTAIEAWDGRYAQRKEDAYGNGVKGLVRTLTCSLVSSRAKVCIDAVPIHASTNEMGQFQDALRDLNKTYGKDLFRLVSTDAGMCSLSNADAVKEYNKEYLFCIKNDQPTLLAEAKRHLLAEQKALIQTTDVVGNNEVIRRLYLSEEMAGYLDWKHLRTVLRVESVKIEIATGREVEREDRYFITSLDASDLTPGQWLYVVRKHWAVENQCHYTWDVAFEEDEHPWIVLDPQGALVLMLLRRMAFNILALFRNVTQRSEDKRQAPWKDIMRWMYNAVISARHQEIATLRPRQGVAVFG